MGVADAALQQLEVVRAAEAAWEAALKHQSAMLEHQEQSTHIAVTHAQLARQRDAMLARAAACTAQVDSICSQQDSALGQAAAHRSRAASATGKEAVLEEGLASRCVAGHRSFFVFHGLPNA